MPAARPRLLLFDIDGTLVKTAGAGRAALGSAFGSVFGVDAERYAAARVRFDGATDPTIVRQLAEALGVEAERLDTNREEFYESYFAHLRREMSSPNPARSVMPGVERLLDELGPRADVELGLLTGNLERSARIKLEPFGLNGHFDDGGFGSDHDDRREIARIARERSSRRTGRSFAPADVTVIGDTEKDVDCATFNGFRAVAVATGWTDPERLRAAGPDALLEDLSDAGRVASALGL